MTIRWIVAIIGAGCALVAGPALCAGGADYYRGGWRSDEGPQRIYQFVIDGDQVSGIYCTQCADGTTLAPIIGSFSEEGGISFTIRHLGLDGSLASQEHLQAKLTNGRLVISNSQSGAAGGRNEHIAIKDPRGPTPAPYPVAILPPDAPPVPLLATGDGAGRAPPPPYAPPAPWRQLTPDDVTGVWLGFGVGMDKQYFIIRKDGDDLFGLACGRCDNPYTFGALGNFSISGTTLQFDILHQDWGEGSLLPFHRRVTAHIAMNEMRIDARRSDAPQGPGIVASLVGPITIEATQGNRVEE